jgi:hypothetical protein
MCEREMSPTRRKAEKQKPEPLAVQGTNGLFKKIYEKSENVALSGAQDTIRERDSDKCL